MVLKRVYHFPGHLQVVGVGNLIAGGNLESSLWVVVLELSFNIMELFVRSWSSMISHWLFLHTISRISFHMCWCMLGGHDGI